MNRPRPASFQCKATATSFVALAASMLTLQAATYNWVPTTAGPFNWDDTTTPTNNWGTAGTFPDNSGDVANVTSNVTANQTINLNEQITVGVLNVGDTNATNTFTIAAGGGSFFFDNGAAAAQLNQTSTSAGDTISAPISVGGNGTLTVANASTAHVLTLSGSMGEGLGNAATVTFNGAGTTLVSGAISDGSLGGTLAVSQVGAGVLTLSGANSYSGGTTLSAGTLNIDSATALGTGTFTINGGTIDDNSSGDITISTNTPQVWNGDFAFTGTHNLNLGNGPVTLGGNRTVTVNGSTLTVGGVINDNNASGTSLGYGLTKAGTGDLTLNAANTYTGTTTILNGNVNVGNSQAFGTGTSAILLGATSGSNNTQISLQGVNLGRNITLQSGNTGTDTLYTRYDTFNGYITGTVTLGSANGAGHSLTIYSGNQFAGVIGQIVDPVGLVAGTAGSVTLNVQYNLPEFGNGGSTYTGNTIINNGGNGIIFGNFGVNGSVFGNGGTVNFVNGLTVNQVGSQATLTGTNPQIWNGTINVYNTPVYFNMTGPINLGSTGTDTTRTFSANSGSSIAGPIQNGSNGFTNSLLLNGGNTLTISGANAYTGGTSLTAGTTVVTGGSGLATTQTGTTTTGSNTIAVTSIAGLALGEDVTGTGIPAGAIITALTAATTGANPTPATVTINTPATATGSATDTFAAFGSLGTGTATVAGGTLQLGVSNALYTPAALAVSGTTGGLGVFNFNGFNQTVGALSGANGVSTDGTTTYGAFVYNPNTSTASTLTVSGTSPTSSTFSGVLTNSSSTATGSLSLVKSGTSTLTLGGDNSYTGTTTVNGGTLIASGTGVAATTQTFSTTASSTLTPTSTSGLVVGERLSGTGIPANTFITQVGATTIGINNNASAATNSTITFAAISSLGTGAATVNGGTLQATAVGALAQNSSLTVNTGGILRLSATNALGTGAPAVAAGSTGTIAGTVPLTMGGGTLLRDATVSQGNGSSATVGIGLLTLTAGTTSTLNFGTTGSGTLSFSAFSPGAGSMLNVLNDNNTTGMAGKDGSTDRLIFNQNLVTAGTIGNIDFNGVAATNAQEISLGSGEYEIVPLLSTVPEPSTWMGLLMLMAAGGQYLRRRGRTVS